MPVCKRKNRKRTVAGVEAWYDVFETEFDFGGDLMMLALS